VIHEVILNGQLLWDGKFHENHSLSGAVVEESFLYLNDLQPGHYEYSVSYGREIPSFTQEPLIYPLAYAREDAETSGNWGGIYGRDGYVLFDYEGVKKDRCELPPYVVSVQPSSRRNGGCLHAQLSVSIEDQRAPAPGRRNEPIRNVGQLYTGDPVACQQTMTVDVEVIENQKYKVALYFLDWDRMGRRQAVEVFDLKTLNRIAPVEIVKNFEQGKYLIYDCAQSARFRINQIRGKNAVLNAIFFDPIV
jgi:hypothetical protein